MQYIALIMYCKRNMNVFTVLSLCASDLEIVYTSTEKRLFTHSSLVLYRKRFTQYSRTLRP